mgnify:CR=1 FL=1
MAEGFVGILLVDIRTLNDRKRGVVGLVVGNCGCGCGPGCGYMYVGVVKSLYL